MDSSMFGAGTTAAESRSAVAAENWKLLRAFNYYRIAIALAAAALAISGYYMPPFGETDPKLFGAVGVIYLALSLAGIETMRRQQPGFETQATFLAFADVALLTLLMHASNGLTSGLGLLLLVAVAGASLMLSTRFTVFYAALATVAIGIQQNWGLLQGGKWITDGYTQAGLLGLGLFATAGLTHLLARRLRATEALAEKRGVDLADLSQLNELIIQRMQSGVVACDQAGRVRMMNKTARDFLGVRESPEENAQLADVSPDLAIQFFQWTGRAASPPGRKFLNTRAGYSLLPRFIPMGERRQDKGVLIFLEDTAILKQQAQQLKMSALARLTASIAHEIRNPLGAITHAAQLLAESTKSDEEDLRLVRIIKDQSRRMNIIVENVTQLSRRDRVNPSRVQLKMWLADFIQQFAQTGRHPVEVFQTAGVTDVDVCVDPEQLNQVVGNLCQNALRHSPPFSGEPLISFKTGHDPDRRPFLDVIDWGSGVPPEIVDNIFDPFFTTTPKGTGLGLYIARELCEGNGARLDYHPGSGVGSRFRVTFARGEECAEMPLGAL